MLSDHIKRTTREIDAFLERYTLGTLRAVEELKKNNFNPKFFKFFIKPN